MKRMYLLLPLAASAAALVVAGCGGGGSKSTSSSVKAKPSKPAPSAPAAAVDLRASSLGRILVNSQGRTLYLFLKDRGPRSTCSGACAASWPPVTTTAAATGGTGIVKAKLGTTARSDGTKQITYNGHPLYTYAGDSATGQMNGEGLNQFGAEWYVLSPAGQKVEKPGS
jgi:predicted lipoprotein with Yx(FWY)xxD motif